MNAKVNQAPPVVMIVAGVDPSGGAGICADIQAVTELGAHPAPVISALTVQDTRNAYDVQSVASDFVAAQMRAVLDDMPVAAIKLGLLGSTAVGEAVAEVIRAHPGIPLVLDPVLVAAGGARLAEEDLVAHYYARLFALTDLVTPNAYEVRQLNSEDEESLVERIQPVLDAGADHVLIKGGDEPTEDVHNCLVGRDGLIREWTWPRIPGEHHGSGCTLASAIAARLALGDAMVDACERGQDYTRRAIEAGFTPGKGQRVPQRALHPFPYGDGGR